MLHHIIECIVIVAGILAIVLFFILAWFHEFFRSVNEELEKSNFYDREEDNHDHSKH